MTAYVKSDDNDTKWMYFFTDDEFLECYNDNWSKACKSIKRVLHGESVYNNKLLKPKTKSAKNSADFHCNDTLEVGFELYLYTNNNN